MLQFYFLSILLNLLIGLVLIYGRDIKAAETDSGDNSGEASPDFAESSKKNIFSKFFGAGTVTDDRLFYLVTGILSVFVALIKLLSPVHGIPFLGDLFPVIAGFAGGASILLQYFVENSSTGLDLSGPLGFFLVDCKKYIGIGCIVIAIVHFVLPGVLFL